MGNTIDPKLLVAIATVLAFFACCAVPASSSYAQTVPAPSAVGTATYQNPLPVDIADPFILRHGDTYYLYGTTSPGEGFHVWTSSDLVDWNPRGLAFTRTERSWAREHLWAPCVVERDGQFYLFYSGAGPASGGRHGHRICVARADSPLGPFTDLQAPLLDIGRSVIDAHVLIDDDGRAYLYYSLDKSENRISEIYVVGLSDDFRSVTTAPRPCIRPSQPWEGGTWNEAPFVFRHDPTGTYVMTYSGQGFFDPRYSVGVATAPSPTGPWTKYDANPILHRTPTVSGPGHNCIVPSPDGRELFIAYHVHRHLTGGNDRKLAIDRLTLDASTGQPRLSVMGPTSTPQPVPSNVRTPITASVGTD